MKDYTAELVKAVSKGNEDVITSRYTEAITNVLKDMALLTQEVLSWAKIDEPNMKASRASQESTVQFTQGIGVCDVITKDN